ncbi:MAG: NUDIX hydrolase [Elusimicrobia bacterium]|jgi:ADP-ribose pyrophosphatase|nr:NUDIX hydrolase [Elusimicrobiota bacterium]
MSSSLVERGLRRRRVYRGKAVDFWVDTVRLPSGGISSREYLGHPGAVAVVAVAGGPKKNPDLLLVRQYRYPVKEVTLELPAGKLDPGETPVVCVRRELEEETGFRAGRVRKMLSYWPTPAFANEVIHLYEARDLTAGTFSPDADEFIEPVRLSLRRALDLVRLGRIKDSKTVIGLYSFDRRLRLG